MNKPISKIVFRKLASCDEFSGRKPLHQPLTDQPQTGSGTIWL